MFVDNLRDAATPLRELMAKAFQGPLLPDQQKVMHPFSSNSLSRREEEKKKIKHNFPFRKRIAVEGSHPLFFSPSFFFSSISPFTASLQGAGSKSQIGLPLRPNTKEAAGLG
jgi:hypothetical protein